MLVHNVLDKIDADVIDVFTHPGVKTGTLKYKNIVQEKGQILVLDKGQSNKKGRCC